MRPSGDRAARFGIVPWMCYGRRHAGRRSHQLIVRGIGWRNLVGEGSKIYPKSETKFSDRNTWCKDSYGNQFIEIAILTFMTSYNCLLSI